MPEEPRTAVPDDRSASAGGRSGSPERYSAALANEIETRWQGWWAERETYRQPNPGEPGFDASRRKFYCLDMFPYPSGAGLHVGHPLGYIATDIVCRYKRMRGFNVLHPMGWDAFGLPAEQYAIQTGVHPAEFTRGTIDTFRRQLQRFGFCYDWSREFATIDEDYYRWTQWIFLRIYGSWFDPDAGSRGRARPIEELVEELEQGRRSARLNPAAAEHTSEEKRHDFGPWADLDERTRRRIIDSYRLAYVAEQTVNWCPKLGTALANEEVIDGRSERGDYPVYRKPLRQWMLRITAYADRLLADLPSLDWPESTRTQQAEWIGRSEGAQIRFDLPDAPGGRDALEVYTTRPDTLFGATYMVVAPEHPLVEAVLAAPSPATDTGAVRAYVEEARNKGDVERQEAKRKTGVALGVDAVNPATGRPVPVWVADYVLMGYGSGAIMAVPAHDERDHEFAEAFGLPIVEVVRPADGVEADGCFSGQGVALNSANDEVSLDGLTTPDAKERIIAWLESRGLGSRKVNYRLRDWLFSRQRYWGEPFPIVYDADGLHHPVRDDALPVTLPALEDYKPAESEDPRPLLDKAADWVHTTAGEAGAAGLAPDAPVRRETNTMPGWAGSCWYYLRYCAPRSQDAPAGRRAERYWMLGAQNGVSAEDADRYGTFEPHLHRLGGVDLYIGGAEHAVLHLLYARFWHKVLFDLGEVSTPEPFNKLFHQGLLTSFAYQRSDGGLVAIDEVDDAGDGRFVERATGAEVTQITAKMSKSLRNVVNPDDIITEFGADTFRLYEMYMGPLEASKPWNTRDTVGLFRFLQRAWRLCIDEETGAARIAETRSPDVERALHRTIRRVGEDIERLSLNTGIAALIEFVNAAMPAQGEGAALTEDQIDRFACILAPFAPHVGEELWSRLGRVEADGSVTRAPWPEYEESMLVDAEVEIPVQIQGKVRSRIRVAPDADAAALEAAAMADERVRALLEGKTVRKVIAIPGRMVNIVAG